MGRVGVGLVLGVVLGALACNEDSEEAAGAGTGANGGASATDSGGTGGRAGGAAGGGAGDAGIPVCCGVDVLCPEGYSCAGPDLRAHLGTCEPAPEDGSSCWNTYDCPADGICTGQTTCSCDEDCLVPNSPGTCEPMGEPCCRDTDDCDVGELCVGAGGYAKGRCEALPAAGECYTDADCAAGTCAGAAVCQCGANCPTLPGTCSSG